MKPNFKSKSSKSVESFFLRYIKSNLVIMEFEIPLSDLYKILKLYIVCVIIIKLWNIKIS